MAQFLRRVAQRLEIVMHGQLHALDAAADAGCMGALLQVAHTGMVRRGGAVYLGRLAAAVRLPLVGHRQHRQHETLAVTQGNAAAGLDLLRQAVRHIQRDRDGPQRAVGQAQRVDHRLVLRLTHEAAQR